MTFDRFKVDRRLLNPKFEGYKLEPILQEDAVSKYTLSRKPTQATASTRLPLSFEEMRSRITHNHLTVESDSGLATYIDEEYNVCLIGVPTTGDDPSPSFRILYEMPTPIDASSGSTESVLQREYPSSAFLGPGMLAVSDGNGLLYILPIKEEQGPTLPIGIFTLPTSGTHPPFKIHYFHRVSPISAILLLSSRHYRDDAQKPAKKSGTTHTQMEFDVWAVRIELLSLRVDAQCREFEILWHRRGQDVPFYTTFVEEVKSYLILSGSSFPDPNVTFAKHYEPQPEEIAPVPRADENLDSETLTTDATPPKPHPYSWTQTEDSVTVAFPLPSSTPKSKIKVIFTMQTLTLHVDALPLQPNGGPEVPIPHYTTKALWDSVNPSSCLWTWDREAEHAYGLLTLHMEKKNENTRWMQVFAASAISASASAVTGRNDDVGGDDENMEVPESVDPSEMVKIRESFEKWTSSLASGEDSSGLGLGRGVPSLMEGEVDDEVDAQVGRITRVTWVGEGGVTPEWTKVVGGGANDQRWEDTAVTILSTPLPGTLSGGINDLRLVLKQDLDGAVFSLKVATDAAPGSVPVWEHTSTYSALAFVLASKRDTRFTHHLPSRGVLAFEGGSLRDRGANVYIYRPSGKSDKWAKQSVLQVDNGTGGAVLGVGCVKMKGGKEGGVVLVCLTEGELVLINGV